MPGTSCPIQKQYMRSIICTSHASNEGNRSSSARFSVTTYMTLAHDNVVSFVVYNYRMGR